MLKPKPTPRRRRVFAVAAILAGVGLIALEVAQWARSGPEVWFWLFVAGLAILLGVIDLLAPSEKE